MSFIDLIAGARPNFMKIAPIIRAIDEARREGGSISYRLIHTGQHYDKSMSGDFFAQLGIPEPHVNLEVRSGTQAEQTANIMTRYEKVLLDRPSKLCLVVGDVTSTMACSITAQKLGIPVAHVEAGIRSGDWSMPEEINRIVTDSISNYFFTTSRAAGENLLRSGASNESIFFVGNTMIDTLLYNINRLVRPPCWDSLSLSTGRYIILTLHRPANVDDPCKLKELLVAIGSAAAELPIVFPVHPRTSKTLASGISLPPNILVLEPQPYLEFVFLVKNAAAVITDSGGITEEATVLGVPCMTLRNSTERPETVTQGTNELLGTDPSSIEPAFERLYAGRWKKGTIPDLWDGQSSQRIVKELQRLINTL